MKPLYPSIITALLATGILQAQSDAVRAAIERFEQSRRDKKPNEVTVVLEPPAPVNTGSETATDSPEAPDHLEPAGTRESTPGKDTPDITKEEPLPYPSVSQIPAGVSVSVKRVRAGEGELDPESISVHAPFPAKPLADAPSGWRIETSEEITPFQEVVELEKGKSVTLDVMPHILVPETDGMFTFSIVEPGYDPRKEYHQTATLGAILARSVEQLDEDSKQLGSTLDQLEQILLSLPKPAAKAVIIEDPELSSP